VRYNLLYTVAAVVSLTISSSHAATPPDLRMVAAKAAAAVKRVIPGSEGEVQGTLAVVKKRTRRTPRTDTSGSWDVPDDYGVMFMIRLLHGPYSGPRAAKTPQFNVTAIPAGVSTRQNVHDWYLRRMGCVRTTATQEFKKSNTVMLVEVLFGVHVDKHILEQAYAELTQAVASELHH
jgi:hypothetical protein